MPTNSLNNLPEKFTDKEGFALASAARALLQASRFNSPQRYNEQELSSRSGVEIDMVHKVLSTNSGLDEVLRDLRGKDWDRLLSAASIYPEDWIKKAEVPFENVKPSPNVRNAICSGSPPTAEADKKIKLILSIINSFYYWASSKYIAQHGRTIPSLPFSLK